MLKEIITSIHLTQKKALKSAVIFMCIAIPIAFFVGYKFAKAPHDDNFDTLKYVNACTTLLALSSVIVFFYLLKRYRQFKKHFVKQPVFPLHWQYDSGDLLVLNNAGVIQYLSSPPKKIITTKFKGITWSADDLKDIGEDILKNGVSIATFLPSLKFATETNAVDRYISFSRRDTISLIFFDFNEGGLLFIDIRKGEYNLKMNLVFPVPDHIVFGKEEFDSLIDHLNISGTVNSFYGTEESLHLLEEE